MSGYTIYVRMLPNGMEIHKDYNENVGHLSATDTLYPVKYAYDEVTW